MGFLVGRAILFIAIAATLQSCCSDDSCRLNDTSLQDRYLSSAVNDPNASAKFRPAQSLLKTNCLQCHAAFGSYTEAQWVSAGYVVPGFPGQSLLLQKIRGSGTGGPENMPPGSTLAPSEISAISDWVTSMSGSGGGSTPVNTDPSFSALQVALNRRSLSTGNSCNSCHQVPVDSVFYSGQVVPAFGNFTRTAEFVTSQLIIPGNASSSWLFRSLRGSSGDIASMPKSDTAAVSGADLTSIADWINQQ